jgi:hypothetical protein
MIIPGQFCFNCPSGLREEALKWKMATTAGISLTLDPINCPRMIIGRSSIKFLFFMPIGNPRWLPPQVIVLTQDHMGKIQKYKEAF